MTNDISKKTDYGILSNEEIKKQRRENLKELRGKKSQEQLARIFNVSRQTVNDWESGDTIPHWEYLTLYREKFNVSFDFLFGISKFRNPEDDYIGKKTGLSPSAVDILKKIVNERLYTFTDNNENKHITDDDMETYSYLQSSKTINFINFVLEHYEERKDTYNEPYIFTIFSVMNEFIDYVPDYRGEINGIIHELDRDIVQFNYSNDCPGKFNLDDARKYYCMQEINTLLSEYANTNRKELFHKKILEYKNSTKKQSNQTKNKKDIELKEQRSTATDEKQFFDTPESLGYELVSTQTTYNKKTGEKTLTETTYIPSELKGKTESKKKKEPEQSEKTKKKKKNQ
ncbi:MAG: helix-turn-helix domain-containing protein [Lachnospiraceae bacterium]|nr:helix-turn-helix domain-containing protein [Lachnospiraceae bacterium]